jgi:hypothetical protein
VTLEDVEAALGSSSMPCRQFLDAKERIDATGGDGEAFVDGGEALLGLARMNEGENANKATRIGGPTRRPRSVEFCPVSQGVSNFCDKRLPPSARPTLLDGAHPLLAVQTGAIRGHPVVLPSCPPHPPEGRRRCTLWSSP